MNYGKNIIVLQLSAKMYNFVHGHTYILFVGTQAEYDKTDCKTI